MSLLEDLEAALTALRMIEDNHQGESWSAGVAMSVLESIRERDGYTMLSRLCNDDGTVERDRHGENADYRCTGHAHYGGEHILCTSPAHRAAVNLGCLCPWDGEGNPTETFADCPIHGDHSKVAAELGWGDTLSGAENSQKGSVARVSERERSEVTELGSGASAPHETRPRHRAEVSHANDGDAS